MLIDSILGSYRQGEGLSAEDTAVLAEEIIKAHRDRTSLCVGVGATQRELKSYFLRVRDTELYACFRELGGIDTERYEYIAKRLQWRLKAGLPRNMDRLDHWIQFVVENNLPIPASVTRIREIILTVESAEDDEEWLAC